MIKYTVTTGYDVFTNKGVDEVTAATDILCEAASLFGVDVTYHVARGYTDTWGAEPVLVVTHLGGDNAADHANVLDFARHLRNAFHQDVVLLDEHHVVTTIV